LDSPLQVQHTRNVVGSFYEALGAFILSAERWTGGDVYACESHRVEYDGEDPPCLQPDLIRRRDSTFIEVKGGAERSTFKIYRHQAELYAKLRRCARFPIYRPRIEYILFMHRLRGMTRKYKTVRSLLEALAVHTVCAVHLDLDALLRFNGWCGTAEYENGRVHYPCFYTTGPRHMRALLRAPARALEEMGLDVSRFRVRKWIAPSPEAPLLTRVFVGETPLTPFPVTSIIRPRRRRAGYDGPIDPSWKSLIRQEHLFAPEPDMLDNLAEEIPF